MDKKKKTKNDDRYGSDASSPDTTFTPSSPDPRRLNSSVSWILERSENRESCDKDKVLNPEGDEMIRNEETVNGREIT